MDFIYSPWGRKESDMTEQLHILSSAVGTQLTRISTVEFLKVWFLSHLPQSYLGCLLKILIPAPFPRPIESR